MRLTALLFVASQVLWAASSAGAQATNVLLIMADDLGWQDLRCQGNKAIHTPRLDAFATQGVRFTNACAASPVCSPTRAALITGLAPARLHITQHGKDTERFWPEDRSIQPPTTDNRLPLKTTTLAERLKQAGYATGFFGKWHLGDDEAFWPTTHGFDMNLGGCGLGGPPTYFDPYRIPTLPPRKTGEYLTDRLADETIGFMREHTDQPMFICLWTYNPHFPFEAPEELVANFRGNEGPGLKNAIYAAQLEATDRAIGRVLDEVDRLGLAEETLVIFTSDNGGWTGATDNRPLREGKGHLHEGGLRVPLIVRWPGVTQAGTVEQTPVITMDLSATILDAAGVPLGEGESLDGVTLRPLFEGKKLGREAITFHYPHWAFHKENRPGAAIRTRSSKLIHNFDDGTLELYDLEMDPGETRNLAAEQPAVAAALNHRLTEWLKDVQAGIPSRRNRGSEQGTLPSP